MDSIKVILIVFILYTVKDSSATNLDCFSFSFLNFYAVLLMQRHFLETKHQLFNTFRIMSSKYIFNVV